MPVAFCCFPVSAGLYLCYTSTTHLVSGVGWQDWNEQLHEADMCRFSRGPVHGISIFVHHRKKEVQLQHALALMESGCATNFTMTLERTPVASRPLLYDLQLGTAFVTAFRLSVDLPFPSSREAPENSSSYDPGLVISYNVRRRARSETNDGRPLSDEQNVTGLERLYSRVTARSWHSYCPVS